MKNNNKVFENNTVIKAILTLPKLYNLCNIVHKISRVQGIPHVFYHHYFIIVIVSKSSNVVILPVVVVISHNAS